MLGRLLWLWKVPLYTLTTSSSHDHGHVWLMDQCLLKLYTICCLVARNGYRTRKYLASAKATFVIRRCKPKFLSSSCQNPPPSRLWGSVASEVFARQVVVLDKGRVQPYAANILPVLIFLEWQDLCANGTLDPLDLVRARSDAGVEEANHVVA